MGETLLVIVDADTIIARTNVNDANHQKTLEISKKLETLRANILYPRTAILEAITFIQRSLGNGAGAYAMAVEFLSPNTNIIDADAQIYSQAVKNYFSAKTSKKNTLFDCLVAATAQNFNADAIFSFDKFYKKQGFKLASEL